MSEPHNNYDRGIVEFSLEEFLKPRSEEMFDEYDAISTLLYYRKLTNCPEGKSLAEHLRRLIAAYVYISEKI